MSLKEFQVIQKLGEGAYSSVFKVKRQTDGQEYALKKVKLQNLSEKEKQNALNEVRILASIRSNSIIGYKEAFLDELSNSLCIIMEYANHGDLFQKIVDHQKKGQLFPEHEIWNIFIQMVKGIKALHDLKIFHRDLKSANVFLNKDGTVKMGDMNVSKVAKKGLLYTQTGTPYYASPEVWKDQPYDAKSDIWSLGCVLYEMITLKPPFRAEDMEGLYKKVIRGYYPRIPPHFSQDLANVVRALLQVAPHLRPSADKILQLPAMLKRVNETHFLEVDEGVPILLTTIRVPKNLHYLTDKLPKPNYQPLKTKRVDKNRFLQTIGVTSMQREGIMDNDDISVSSQAEPSLALPQIHGQKSKHPGVGSKAATAAAATSALLDNTSQNNSISNNNHSGVFKDNASDAASINQSVVIDLQSAKKRKKKPEVIPDQNSSAINSNSSLIPSQTPGQVGGSKRRVMEGVNLEKEVGKVGGRHLDIGGSQSVSPLPKKQPQVQQQQQSILQTGQSRKDLLLDIEGESKPLLKKKAKNPSIHQSKQYDDASIFSKDEGSRLLPIISGAKLPKIVSHNANNNMSPLGPSKYQLSDKENQKIKEISRAYKVNMSSIDEIKDRYMQLKKSEQTRSKQYGIKGGIGSGQNSLEMGIGGHKYYSHESSSLPSLHRHK